MLFLPWINSFAKGTSFWEEDTQNMKLYFKHTQSCGVWEACPWHWMLQRCVPLRGPRWCPLFSTFPEISDPLHELWLDVQQPTKVPIQNKRVSSLFLGPTRQDVFVADGYAAGQTLFNWYGHFLLAREVQPHPFSRMGSKQVQLCLHLRWCPHRGFFEGPLLAIQTTQQQQTGKKKI